MAGSQCFVATAILFTICQLCCSVCRSFPGCVANPSFTSVRSLHQNADHQGAIFRMLVARSWAGVGGSTFSTMVGGIVTDIYPARSRNTPMACFSSAALFGTGLGPIVCGFIAEYTTWRWIFYIQIIIGGMISAAVILFFQETRNTVILRKKAKLLNKWSEKLEDAGIYSVRVAGKG